LLFRKRQKRGGMPPGQSFDSELPPERQQLFRIDFEMMLKGSTHRRRKGPVRQYGVTVNGSTRLVTSGDVVDLDTYRALLAAGAIRPVGPDPMPELEQTSVAICDPAADHAEE
jgi:hypothetical protein